MQLSNDDQPWNLTYRRQSSPKDEYEGVIAFWRPVMERAAETPCDADGGAYISLTELKARTQAGADLAGVVKLLQDVTAPVPPIRLLIKRAL